MLVLFMSLMFMQASLQFCEGTYTDDERKLEGKFHSDKTNPGIDFENFTHCLSNLGN